MTTNKISRIHAIDALRGFALAGIVLVHMAEQFTAAPMPESFAQAVNPGLTDQILGGLVTFFIRGKFFALFSILFGLSFYLQMQGLKQRSAHPGLRFLWRLALLMVFGLIHHMFYRGDILTLYAILGVLMIPFDRFSSKALIALIAFIFLGGFRYLVFLFTGGEPILVDEPFTGDTPVNLHYFDLLQSGSLPEVIVENSTRGHIEKLEFQFGIFNRGYLTFAFFLCGILLGRQDFFRFEKSSLKWIKPMLLWGALGTLVSLIGVAAVFSTLGQNPDFNSWMSMLGLTLYDLGNIFMTLLYIGLFAKIWQSKRGQRFLNGFSNYGRMALTNYLLQTLVGTFILYNWGLGFIGQWTTWMTLVCALVIIALQIMLSNAWLKYFLYGPLEWLWRSLTWFRSYPLKRE